MTLKVAIFNIFWLFLSIPIHFLNIENDEVIGAWVLVLLIGMGLLSGLLKEHSHDKLIESKKHFDYK